MSAKKALGADSRAGCGRGFKSLVFAHVVSGRCDASSLLNVSAHSTSPPHDARSLLRMRAGSLCVCVCVVGRSWGRLSDCCVFRKSMGSSLVVECCVLAVSKGSLLHEQRPIHM